MRKTALLSLIIFTNSCLQAQSAWEIKSLPGFLIPHHTSMAEMMAHIQGFELGREWRLDSAGDIDKKMHHPTAGIAINYFDLGRSFNGKAFSILGFCEVGKKLGKHSSFRVRLSSGIGYLTEKFNIYTNTTNRAIGTNVNGFMQLLTYIETPLTKRLILDLGVGISHFSNGNWGQPNLGINLPSLVLGLKYKDKGQHYIDVLKMHAVPEKVQFTASARFGRRQLGIDDRRSLYIYIAEATLQYPLSKSRMFRLGLLGFFDRSYPFEKFQPQQKNYRLDQITELAVQIGHEYRIGRVGVGLDFGVYLYRPEKTKRAFYEGLAIKYYVTPNLALVNRLKAHLTSADYFEWGIAYSFTSKKIVKPGMRSFFRWIGTPFKPVQ